MIAACPCVPFFREVAFWSRHLLAQPATVEHQLKVFSLDSLVCNFLVVSSRVLFYPLPKLPEMAVCFLYPCRDQDCCFHQLCRKLVEGVLGLLVGGVFV